MSREKLMCETLDGDWNSKTNQCEFDQTSNHIDCMKRTVEGVIEGGVATGIPEGAVVKGTKELIQCYSEKTIYQKTYEKLEVSDGHTEKFTEERTHIQVDARHDTVNRKREQRVEEKNFVSDVEDSSQPVPQRSKHRTCPKCGREMENKTESVYICPKCSSKFIEN